MIVFSYSTESEAECVNVPHVPPAATWLQDLATSASTQ